MIQPMCFEQRTSVGLDVHARSVAGCGLDGQTGEVFERRLSPDQEWITSLPQPVSVAYEAGPTGYGAGPLPGGRADQVPGRGAVEAAAPAGGSGEE